MIFGIINKRSVQISIGVVGEKNQKLTSGGMFVLHSSVNPIFVNWINFKYFVDSILSTNKYKNFDFKLDAIKRGQTYKFTSLLKDISQERSATADKDVPYCRIIDSLINYGVFLDWYVKRF